MGRFLTAAEQQMDPVERFWSYIDRRGPDECWLWTKGVTKAGYGTFQGLTVSRTYAHRVAWFLTFGEDLPPSVHLCHLCDTPRCCNPHHLFKGDATANRADATRKGRAHALGYEAAQQIRTRAAAGTSIRNLAGEYGVTYEAVRLIVRGRSWPRPSTLPPLWRLGEPLVGR